MVPSGTERSRLWTRRAAVAVSDKPEGPYRFVRSGRVNPGIYPENMPEADRKLTWNMKKYKKWWTPEWYKAVNQGLFVKRDIEGGQMSRDMTLFVDDDGKAYHIYSSEENLTLHIAELTDDYLQHSGRYIRIFPGGHNEAPALFKKVIVLDDYFGCTGWDPNEAVCFQRLPFGDRGSNILIHAADRTVRKPLADKVRSYWSCRRTALYLWLMFGNRRV